jgi:hypothetical protein
MERLKFVPKKIEKVVLAGSLAAGLTLSGDSVPATPYPTEVSWSSYGIGGEWKAPTPKDHSTITGNSMEVCAAFSPGQDYPSINLALITANISGQWEPERIILNPDPNTVYCARLNLRNIRPGQGFKTSFDVRNTAGEEKEAPNGPKYYTKGEEPK